IVASGLLLLYLGEGYQGWRRLARSRVADAFEGGGAAVFALCGFASMLAGAAFLQNVLPYGPIKGMLSGGLMQLENAGVAFAVAGGFTVLFIEFLEETRTPETEEEGDLG
ncbi:MAG: MnhB domain-containing protein, partial [Acetobacteraceae bacterium]|nr:MnhB domain-containing protein [Acetobacteraceae bacterium]